MENEKKNSQQDEVCGIVENGLPCPKCNGTIKNFVWKDIIECQSCGAEIGNINNHPKYPKIKIIK